MSTTAIAQRPKFSPNEAWRCVCGYEYEVSDIGNVRRIGSNKNLSTKGRHGYRCVTLCKNNTARDFYIHRLVAFAFLPNPDALDEINHIDSNRSNNHIDNLEFCTHQGNMQHAAAKNRMGSGMRGKTGSKHFKAKKIIQCDKNGNAIREWCAIMDAVRFLDKKTASHIVQVLHGHRKTAYGYKWKFKEVYS